MKCCFGIRIRPHNGMTSTAESEKDKPNVPSQDPPEGNTCRKRGRADEPEEDLDEVDLKHAPIISNDGMVEFSLAGIQKHLICGLCSGYYKDPYTITDCLHTFCKSCLFYSVASGCHECPLCNVYLGSDPLKVAVLDHSMQDLLDRIVFPGLAREEEEAEKEFYAERGIQLKPEFAEKDENKSMGLNFSNEPPNTSHSKDDELECTLMPEITSTGNDDLPPLDRPCLRISSKFQMSSLKKYISQQIGLSSASQPALDILCNGVPLGDEISLGFVKRLLWHHESDLALLYRIAHDQC